MHVGRRIARVEHRLVALDALERVGGVAGAFSPTSGILSSAFVVTGIRTGAPTSRPFWRVASSTAHVPALSNGTSVE